MVTISWTTGTQTEALSCSNVNGTAYNTSVAVTVISPAEGAAYVPANFWLPTYGASKGLLVKAHGVLGTTSTPNLTLAVVASTTQGTALANLTAGTAGVLATTGAVAQASTVTNVPWDLEVLISCVTTGASATFLADGIVRVYTASTTIQSMRISSSTANPNTTATIGATGTQSAYYIEIAALWGTSSASNTITLYAPHTVVGLN